MRKLAIALLLAGCTSVEAYETKLNGLLGLSETELVSAWGVPDSTYETGGLKFLQYSSERIVSTGYPVYGAYVGYSTFTAWGGPRFYTRTCETTFTLREGEVVDWRFQGSDCRA